MAWISLRYNDLFARIERERKSAISPIIATLLLILIAIAAGVVVYAYVIGFVGNSTGNTGGTQSVVSIENFCASASGKCSGTQGFSIVIQNIGSTTIAAGSAQIYFTDITASTSGSTSCSIASAVSPGSTYTCTSGGASWPVGTTAPASGDSISVKIVNPDGGTTTGTTKAIA
jgi:flagellin-like protein